MTPRKRKLNVIRKKVVPNEKALVLMLNFSLHILYTFKAPLNKRIQKIA